MGTTDEKRREQTARLADSIKEQERRREELRFREEWSKRIDIAREGRVAYESNDPVTAVLNFKKIFSLTARRHNVSIEDLSPKLFDPKSRFSESLLLSAIAFDLAKIIERLDGDSATRDLKLYLRLFVIFSKSMPYEVIATSTIRKYMLYTRGLKHPQAFEDAYKSLRKGNCFVATVAFGDEDAFELERLRKFRDQVLRPTRIGRDFIHFYYNWGPQLARYIETRPRARKCVRACLQLILKLIHPWTN